MEAISPQAVCRSLDQLDQRDVAASAAMRQQAQAVLADAAVSLERLSQANTRLSRRTVTSGDSY